jgi:hypothetical protein
VRQIDPRQLGYPGNREAIEQTPGVADRHRHEEEKVKSIWDPYATFVAIGAFTLILLPLALTGQAQAPTIHIYAGPKLPEDGAKVSTQVIDSPGSIAADGLGGFYVLAGGINGGMNRIYKIAADGTVTHIAGSGAMGFAGDGGPATGAAFMFPTDLALDWAGNLYVADSYNRRVRMVRPDRTITTVADGGALHVETDAEGNLYMNPDSTRIRKMTPDGVVSTVAGNGTPGYSGDGGPATAARIQLNDFAVDAAGNIYLRDPNGRIRKVAQDGVIRTIAGTGRTGFSGDGGTVWHVRGYGSGFGRKSVFRRRP